MMLRIGSLLMALFGAMAPVLAQYYWEQRADLPTSGLWGPTSFVIDGHGYVVAGMTNGTDVTNTWMYDPILDAWVPKAPIPIPRRYAAGFAINGKGYVACGILGGQHRDDLWEYDPISDTWSSKADFPGVPRYGTHHFTIGGLGYVGSGNSGSALGPYVSDMYAYDPVSNTWVSKSALPGLARYGTSTITAIGHAFVFGGLMSNQQHTGDIYEYDALSDSWTLRAPLPGSTRTYAMALSYSSEGAIVAGKSGAGQNIYDGFRYWPSNNSWAAIPDYPGESGWVGATMAINGRSFGGLGYTLADGNDYNDWWELIKGSAESTNEVLADNSLFQVFPNPCMAGGEVVLTFGLSVPPQTVVGVDVVSHSGQTVRSTQYRVGDFFSVPDIAPGIYGVVVRLRSGENLFSRINILPH